MPHIHTKSGQHDHTVSGYIVRDDGDELRVFLHMHRKQHILMPVGGHIELDETPWDTIGHEMGEESGFEIGDLDVMQPKIRVRNDYGERSVHPVPFVMDTHHTDNNHFHADASYLFVAHGDPAGKPADGESQDIRWLTESQLRDLDESVIRPFTRDMYLQCLQVFMQEWEPVSTTDFRTGHVS